MEKIKKIFNMRMIRNRITVVQLCVVIPAILLLGFVIYNFTCSLLMQDKTESYHYMLEAEDTILEKELENYTDIARTIMSEGVLQEVLIESNQTAADNVDSMSMIHTLRLDKEIGESAVTFSDLISLYVFDLHGRVYYWDSESRRYNIRYKEFMNTKWFADALEQNGKERFWGYNVITGCQNQFSCVKRMVSINTLAPIGMIVLNFDKRVLRDVISAYSNDEDIYAIIDKADDAYYIVSQNAEQTDDSAILDIIQNRQADYHITSYNSNCTDWILVHLIRTMDIVSEADGIKSIILSALIITIIILTVLTILICNRITKPLYQLQDNIIRVGNGERELPNDFKDDEIGVIGQEFGKMIQEKLSLGERILQYELKNKEAELELLQSNINPHFLYNTLDSLYWMAILHKADDIARLTKALSDIFKICLSNGDKMIPVSKEIAFVKNYLYIQNIRFENMIKVDIRVEDELMDYQVIKQILQPVVENAIYHGLEPKVGMGTITILGYCQNEKIVFEISDDGVGMNVEESVLKGYALRNIQERILLAYGGEAGMNLSSMIGKGTKVKIFFPMEGEKIC